MTTRIQNQALAKLLRQLVRKAGEELKRALTKKHRIIYKGENNIATEMDRAVEKLFLDAIRKQYPRHLVLSEEMAETSKNGYLKNRLQPGEWRWIIDPLDGTTNYSHGFPHFCVAAGVENHQGVHFGAVFNPMLDEFFYAEAGRGAYLNDRKILVSKTRELKPALLATGFPYDLAKNPINNFFEFEQVSKHCQAVRRAGAAALDLCDLACGRFDGFWEYRLKAWDVAGASLILQEAGGIITDFQGRPFSVFGSDFVASNGRLHPVLLKTLSGAGRKRRSLEKQSGARASFRAGLLK